MAEPKKMTIDISSLTMIKILGIVLLVAAFFYFREILMLLFVALVFASALNPAVDWLQRHKIPRALGILLIYVLVFVVLFLSVFLIISPITKEINDLTQDFPVYWEKITANWHTFKDFSESHGVGQNIQDYLNYLKANLSLATNKIFGLVSSLFGGLVYMVVLLVMTFYITLEDKSMKKGLRSLLPAQYQPYAMNLINRMQEKIGLWLRGQLVLSLIIFVVSFVGLSLLGVKYALVLAIFAGVTELIPYLGPIIAAVPAIFIASTQSPILGLAVLILYVLIQQSENYFIVPKVMQKAVGLNPIIVLIAMLVGARVAGILGIILSVPVATALGVILKDFFAKKDEVEVATE
ncbi:MAG: AI-2E family transporter [Patescibacteria group bacterium]